MELTQVSHYRILERLGAGGMGEVYLAEDMKLGRKVAIKILSDEYTTNKDRLKRFEQEASAASALNHPNILTIYEVGNDDGRHYIATEYIDGVTLRRKIAANRLETIEILDIAVQIAGALEEAHAAGIIHRDIKPDNIMVRRNGYVKVLDFGLAKLTETSVDRTPSDAEAATRVLVHTDAGVVMGTSHYMSPEQARGKPVDARSDIWSLGVVLYEMVTGRFPFEGETSTDILAAITQKEPSPLARFARDVPPELEWIVLKALRKAPDERYQTIKELLTDLKRLKQKREFEVELERSIAPDSLTRSGLTPVAGAPTVTEKVLTTAEKTVSQVSSAEYIAGGIKSHKFASAVVAIMIVAAVVGLLWYLNRKPALSDKDTVLLADFVNTTGEPVFDGTLKQALSVQLGQSPFLNIFPEERVREALRYMGRPPDDRITRDVGVEICRRQGLKALLLGSISSIGSHYVITLDAVNAQTGDSIAREHIEADSKEKVLSSLGTAASSMRQKLGESLSSIKQYGVGIEQATTSSLEALKAFAMGNEERTKGRTREALALYQRAIELDPNFAMAYARIGVFYGNQS
ncbi:MAG TPA: protein kinase, partial [Pyrinomonadaceae bacterium]